MQAPLDYQITPTTLITKYTLHYIVINNIMGLWKFIVGGDNNGY